MNKTTIYYKQVQLLLRILPIVAQEDCFALKGGTAINLFVRDMPRLSVDIDLVYLPLEERDIALANARAALDRILNNIEAQIMGANAFHTEQVEDSLRLLIKHDNVTVKLELSPVMRGAVFPAENRSVTESVEAEFGYTEIAVTSFPDLYAGKICAALDRQHPRDLYDVKLLLEDEGISDELRKAFLVYLISHKRPISEVLKPDLKENIRVKYEGEFLNMTADPVSVDELENTLQQLIETLHTNLTEDEKQFLLSFKAMTPKWELLGLEGIENLPAVKWKLINLGRMSEKSHTEALKRLEQILYPEQDNQ